MLKIWDTDPNNKPQPRQSFSDDTVGRFSAGRAVDGVPESLDEWRVSTGDMKVAEAISELYGGRPEEQATTSENFIDVLTNTASVNVILEGPSAIYSDMKLWNRTKLVHHCDGVKFLSPDEKKGHDCRCPELFTERKAAARDFVGPSPSISITFRLADDPELGKFKLQTGSWAVAAILHEYVNALERLDGESVAELAIENVEFTIKKGPKKGLHVSYNKPILRNIRSLNSALEEA